jgi:hypothetical protein
MVNVSGPSMQPPPAVRRLRYDAPTGHLILGDRPTEVVVRHDGTAAWVGRIEDVGAVTASTLQAVLRRANGDSAGSDSFEVVENQDPGFDEEYVGSDVHFAISDGRLVLQVVASIDEWIDDDHDLLTRLRQLVRPLLQRGRAEILEAEMLDGPSQGPWACSVTIVPALRGRTVGQLYGLGSDVIALLDAASGGSLTLWSVVQLATAGRADILIGQPECQWLDAKSQDYDLDDDAGKISIAQDVARFANGETGGAVVVGLRTRKVSGGEVISAVSPIRSPRSGVRRHRQAIDNRVFPPPDGLSVQQVAITGGAMIVIYVPPQVEELKPFLVHGAIVNGKAEGAFISILRRRDDESIPITAPSIHATLAAGRALLRRGELPATFVPSPTPAPPRPDRDDQP